jgi:hypothetical protein
MMRTPLEETIIPSGFLWLLPFGQLFFQIIDEVLRAFLREHLSGFVRHVRFLAERLKFIPLRLVIIGSSTTPSYATCAFSRISSISLDASALVRLSSNSSG